MRLGPAWSTYRVSFRTPRALSVILNTVPDLPVGLQETLSVLMHEMGKPYCTPQENGMNEEDPDCTCWSNRSLGLKSSSSLAPALCWVWLPLLAFLPIQSARLGVSWGGSHSLFGSGLRISLEKQIEEPSFRQGETGHGG